MIEEMKANLASLFDSYSNELKRTVKGDWFEYGGHIPAMQGKKQVDSHYFASIAPKPKDLRFYFMPIYCHPNAFNLSPTMKKVLKGKSCFYFKKLDKELLEELDGMIKKGIELYKKDGVI